MRVVLDGSIDLAMSGLRLKAGRHILLPNSRWVESVSEYLGRDDLTLYYHAVEETFVLCEWVHKPYIVLELLLFEEHPDSGRVELPSPRELRHRLRPAKLAAAERRRQLRHVQRERQRDMESEVETRRKLARRYKKEGFPELQKAVNMGLMPVMGEREVERLKEGEP